MNNLTLLSVSTLSIAACSIGIQSMGNPSTPRQKMNHEFLVILLTLSILALLYSMYDIYSSMGKSR